MTRTIMRVVVGSRLHGLATERSDTDYVTVVAAPLIDVLSPFQQEATRTKVQHQEGSDDHVTFELRRFCKLATDGNPTILEVLWSRKVIESSSPAGVLYQNRQKFLDSRRIYDAHLGLARGEMRKFFDSDDEDENACRRRGKSCAAAIRVLRQGIDLLKTGDFSPEVVQHKPFLTRLVREGATTDLIVERALPIITDLQRELDNVFSDVGDRVKPDISWIEQFLFDVYTGVI